MLSQSEGAELPGNMDYVEIMREKNIILKYRHFVISCNKIFMITNLQKYSWNINGPMEKCNKVLKGRLLLMYYITESRISHSHQVARRAGYIKGAWNEF